MPVGALRPSVEPDVSDLSGAPPRAIAAVARLSGAQQTETDRRVGDDMIERMRQADLFRVMQARRFTADSSMGSRCSLRSSRRLRAGAASTGWVYALLASHQWLLACFFSQAAQDEVWAGPPPRFAAGTYAPVGSRPSPRMGGYRLSGVGSFSAAAATMPSGSFLGGMIPQPETERRRPGFSCCAVTIAFIEDNWHTMGVAGTGQQEYRCSGRVRSCPSHARLLRTCRLPPLPACGAPTPKPALFDSPSSPLLPIANRVAGARHGGREPSPIFLAMASVRTTRGAVAGGNRRMAELTTVQLRVAGGQRLDRRGAAC